ncbi:hypothetical protein EJ05DRAFT_9934 [Pseudovirgaria hyperparasitica]|uniref:Uncharacterized protein n=1 Tax=Pseudovirgaria hyperparasitica TaxID=470096 RepID=A0A6A6WKJ9_9PEZI|nr:uncharacterized protein EJ05DRAFT_9934 [Pseudovirgaria hyperparasitica]KAF2762698.1 hypothetical protein EJ05DRAFT_9934 [Pseudovirgaria hyperparasitica]
MQFSTSKLLSMGLSLTALASAAPTSATNQHSRASKVILGYRSVSPDIAAKYNAAGTITADRSGNSAQIGEGAYTAPVRGDKPGGWPGPWNCVVFIDSDALDRVSKAWIPEFRDQGDDERLWYNNERIDEYIDDLEDSWDPTKTLRMSEVSNTLNPTQIQLVVPFTLINSAGGALGLETFCVAQADIGSLPDVTVNYDDWQNNIKGDRHPKSD